MPKKGITDFDEMEAILYECAVGSFATVCPDGTPYVVPVNYVYHNRKIYFHCALKGKKIDNIKHEPRVCFVAYVAERIVQAYHSANFSTRYRSVIINGRARLLTDPEKRMGAIMALVRKYAEGKPFEPPTEQCMDITGIVEIEIDEMTGKRNVDPE